MRLRKTPTYFNFAIFIIVTLLVNLSCDNDSDLFRDTILEDDSVSIDELPSSNSESLSDDNDSNEVDLESRITVFPAVNDAYFEDGTGFNTPLNRLEEDSRISYLMFDLRQIDSIEGVITSATLEFTIHEDTGKGIIDVFKGNSNDWSENNLTSDSAPSKDVLLGSIDKEFKLNERIEIDLDVQEIGLEYATLILFHKGENDLAFASQENNNFEGPKMRVVYETSIDADELAIEDNQEIEEESSESEEESTEEETTEEETTEEETTEEEVEEETGEETEEETTEEETTEEEVEEESSEEENEPDETVNNEPIAVASATPETGFAPLNVQFSGSQSTDDNGIATYEWNFKDGTTSSTSNPQHTFDEVGTYSVTLKVYDDEGKSSTANVLITVEERPNEAPNAVANATPETGFAPLDVQFSGSQSTDDNGIVTYEWNFKDGTISSKSNPQHTFDEVGTYNVTFKVYDAEGKTSTTEVLITVQERPNEAPVAVAIANRLEGDAPLEVYFRGSDSSDDKGISSYYWDFPFDPSAAPNNTRTFTVPGVYQITLTVTDTEGLKSTDQLTITVNEVDVIEPPLIGCVTNGGSANDTGLKTWCWGDLNIPSGASTGRDSFSSGQLALNVECSANQVVREGDRLNFKLNPISPSPASWCNNDYNVRSEIRTMPWGVRNQSGTEEWFGWDYKFDEGYKIDQTNDWIAFQIHDGVVGHGPQVALLVNRANAHGGNAGEIIVNTPYLSQSLRYNPTGVIPVAGQKIKIVVHVIWGNSSKGLLEVWINDVLVHSRQNSTIYPGSDWGGNAKWGIYAHQWRNATGNSSVASSAAQGITDLEISMGALRMITRKSSDPDYKKDAYQEVVPK